MTTPQITRREPLVRAGVAAAVGGARVSMPGIVAAGVSYGIEQIGEIFDS
jgi:hypothetical protein